MEENKKVYCKDCYWLSHWDRFACGHPSNFSTKDTWFERVVGTIAKPEEINANNDCPCFVEKNKKAAPEGDITKVVIKNG